MKKVFWFLSVSLFSVSFAFSQNEDNTYYSNNDNQYNNGYDNSYNNNYSSNDDQSQNTGSDQGYQAFYDQLSPYGSWVNYSSYGYVWVPNQVDANFSPYNTGGHWVYSDYGWTWVSDYSWGWAPFHYGRWFHDDSYGWMWMPGSEWAPAWVTWGSYSGYYCWAPIAPYAELSVYYRPEPHYWNFVPCGYITQVNLGGYVNNNVYIQNNITVIHNNITIINQAGSYNNHTYFAGPGRQEVERVTHQSISPVSVTAVNHAVNTQVSNNQMTIYRPEIRRTSQPAAQFRAQQNVAPNRMNSNAQNNNNVQRNSFANTNAQNQRVQQYTPARQNMNTISRSGDPTQNQRSFNQNQNVQRQFDRNNNVQPQRPQQFVQPSRQSAPERSFNQPAQRQQQYSQPQRQQQFSQPSRPSAPERTFNQPAQRQQQYSQPQRQSMPVERSQPVQRPAERSFASAQHFSQPGMQSSRPATGGTSFNRGRR